MFTHVSLLLFKLDFRDDFRDVFKCIDSRPRYKKLLKRRTKFADYSERRRGIPEQYGIFYALGVALIMEGVLSGCYHICPTKVNFQFDTTFMYVISVLLFLKVYQFRWVIKRWCLPLQSVQR